LEGFRLLFRFPPPDIIFSGAYSLCRFGNGVTLLSNKCYRRSFEFWCETRSFAMFSWGTLYW